MPKQGFQESVPKQGYHSKQGFQEQVPKQGFQASFPSKVPKEPKQGSQSKVPKNRLLRLLEVPKDF